MRFRLDVSAAALAGTACIALLLTLGTKAVAADGPPRLDVRPSCEAAARGAVVAGRNTESCMEDERTAQNEMTNKWSQYAAADKTQCVNLIKDGGPPSYVELLSCLEAMRDARAIHETLEEPLLHDRELNAQAVPLTDLGIGSARSATPTGMTTPHRHKRKRSEAQSQ